MLRVLRRGLFIILPCLAVAVPAVARTLTVQPGESIYDPTCGSGGMLLSCVAELRRQGQESRNVKLYGQERNLMTSSIARQAGPGAPAPARDPVHEARRGAHACAR